MLRRLFTDVVVHRGVLERGGEGGAQVRVLLGVHALERRAQSGRRAGFSEGSRVRKRAGRGFPRIVPGGQRLDRGARGS